MQVTAKLSLAKGQGHRAAGGGPRPMGYSGPYSELGQKPQTLGEKSKVAPPFHGSLIPTAPRPL